MVPGISALASACAELVLDLSRVLQPGNPELCGEVPLNLRGVVAKYVNDTTNKVQEVETLGNCSGAAAHPGTVPKQAPGPQMSAPDREPAPGPTASPRSSALEPAVPTADQVIDVTEPAGPNRVQATPSPAPAVPPIDVAALPPSIAPAPIFAAGGPATSGSAVQTPAQNLSSSTVRLAIACLAQHRL